MGVLEGLWVVLLGSFVGEVGCGHGRLKGGVESYGVDELLGKFSLKRGRSEMREDGVKVLLLLQPSHRGHRGTVCRLSSRLGHKSILFIAQEVLDHLIQMVKVRGLPPSRFFLLRSCHPSGRTRF
jgi:hypothetical protein